MKHPARKTDGQLARKAIEKAKLILELMEHEAQSPLENVTKALSAARAASCSLQELENRHVGLADPLLKV